MIKTVFLSSDYPSDEAIDDQINSWLAENPDIKSSFNQMCQQLLTVASVVNIGIHQH